VGSALASGQRFVHYTGAAAVRHGLELETRINARFRGTRSVRRRRAGRGGVFGRLGLMTGRFYGRS
jgi:hypothetical protein